MSSKKAKGAPERRPCYLRATPITLRDGKTYVFRAMPFHPRNVALFELFLGMEKGDVSTAESMRAISMIASAVRQSLLHDQDEEVVDDLIERGVVPMFPRGDDPIAKEVFEALMAGAGEG